MSTSPYAVPLEALEDGVRVPLAAQATAQAEVRAVETAWPPALPADGGPADDD